MAELQHPDARAFELVAGLYERARPEYPPDAVAWIAAQLDLGPGRTVLDLGAGTGKLTDSLPIQVVVCTDGTNRVGLVVGRILDIVTDPLLVRSSSSREHALFTTVVHSQVTEVLDVASLIAAAEANLVRTGAKI